MLESMLYSDFPILLLIRAFGSPNRKSFAWTGAEYRKKIYRTQNTKYSLRNIMQHDSMLSSLSYITLVHWRASLCDLRSSCVQHTNMGLPSSTTKTKHR